MSAQPTSPQAAAGPDGVEHFVVTRFNLRLSGVEKDKNQQQLRSEEWHHERIDLFERYCLPGMRNQTERRFRWLLLIDEESAPGVVQRLRGHEGGAANLEIVFMPVIESWDDMARPVIERLSPGTRLLVTTRLDSDDAFHETALAYIRTRVRGRREFINPRVGFVTDGRRARVTMHRYSPFNTFVEPRTEGAPLLTVYCAKHGRVREVAPVRQITDRPLWLRVIHERNWVNKEGVHPLKDVRSFRGLHTWLRRRVIAPARALTWPADYRRDHTLAEIAGGFHIQVPPESR